MKKLLLISVRWILPVAIIVWLMVNAAQNDSFSRMRDAPKQWDLLALATVLCFAAVLLTIVRWYFLVRAWKFRSECAMRCGWDFLATCTTSLRRAASAEISSKRFSSRTATVAAGPKRR